MKSLILTAFQKFDRSQSLGGILLFGATIVALIFANTQLGDFYDSLQPDQQLRVREFMQRRHGWWKRS